MTQQELVNELNRQFLIRQIVEALGNATFEQCIEIGKILKF